MRRRDLNRLVDAAASISSPPRISTLAIGIEPEPFRAAGATWWLAELAPDAVSVDRVHAVIRDGPAAHP